MIKKKKKKKETFKFLHQIHLLNICKMLYYTTTRRYERKRQRDRETERQRNRETERQRDRKTERERQRDRERQRETERDREPINKYKQEHEHIVVCKLLDD